ncbi:MAG: hypothetical protein RIQ71_1222 [Verrucomicrobiota bacterium]
MSSSDKSKKSKSTGEEPREKEALLLLSLFFHRYLHAIYGGMDLDLLSVSLLNEIAAHNLEPFVSAGRLRFPASAEEMKLMRGCNAFSLSQATGVPRETVRRKIKQLIKLSWIAQHNSKGLFITTQWIDRLSAGEASVLLSDFKETGAKIDKLLGE